MANQIKIGAILSYISLLINNLVGIIYTPFLLNHLGQSEYGLYTLIASTVGYLTILDFGFGNAIIRYTAKFRAEGKIEEQYSLFGLFIVLYSCISIIVLIFGFWFYFNIDYFFSKSLTSLELGKAQIMSILLIFNITITFPLSVFGSIITAYENFIFQKIIGLIRIILNPIVMIIILTLGYRAIGLVVVTTIFNLITLLINLWFCLYKIKIKIYFKNFNYLFLREIIGYSFWIFLNFIVDKIYWSTGQFILGIYIGTTAVAIYALAMQLTMYYMSFSTSISSILLPKVTAMITNNISSKRFSELFISVGRIQYIILLFILSGFILFGSQFIKYWAGDDYNNTYLITLIILIPLTIPLIQNIGITILQAKNQMKFRSILYIFIAIFSLLISVPLVKLYGTLGAAIGTSLSLFIGNIIIMNVYYQKKLDINIILFWKEITKLTIPVFVINIIAYILIYHNPSKNLLQFILQIIMFSIAYIILIWKVSMNELERNIFKKPVLKYLSK